MLRCVLGDAAQVRLEDVIAIQERHFTIRLDPYLFTTVCTKDISVGVGSKLTLYFAYWAR
jgi:hypothetical protein